MTVKELKEALKDVPDDTEVLLIDDEMDISIASVSVDNSTFVKPVVGIYI